PAAPGMTRHASPDVEFVQEPPHPRVIQALSRETALPHWGSRPESSMAFLTRIPVTHHEWYHPPNSRHAFLELEKRMPRVRRMVPLVVRHGNPGEKCHRGLGARSPVWQRGLARQRLDDAGMRRFLDELDVRTRMTSHARSRG